MKIDSALFDNFNAKNSTQEEVAETFVSNDDFFSIAKNNHTFVLGPRGCGKTTMFKMLTTPAIKNWRPKTARDLSLKENVPFIAIYIPSDELWKDQLKSVTSTIKNDVQLVDFISMALNTTNIFSNFCQGIKNHIEYAYMENNDRKTREFEFSEKLLELWSIEECAATLSSIKLALGSRRERLIEKVNQFVFNKKYNPNENIVFEQFHFADFLSSIKNGITAFENIFNEGKELKWALCFDELELVSRDFFDSIIKKLRIAPPNIVFKLSASPLTEFKTDIAQVFHDYEVVKMWPFSSSEESRYSLFCEEIAKERIFAYREKNNLKKYVEIDFTRIFGSLDYSIYALKEFNFEIDRTANEGQRNSLTWHVFKELAAHDTGLNFQLKKRKIDPDDPEPNNQGNYDSFIRKGKEIAINRLIFSKFKSSKIIKGRSRKEYPIYYGKETIFKVCEGNPRFIINIINDLLIKTEKYRDIDNLTFAPEEQANVVKGVSSRFRAMLNTYPTSVEFNRSVIDLEWLINKVGQYFETEINYGFFKLHPANSFFFKEDIVPKPILSLLELGISLGAFVKIDKNANDIVNDSSTRYRLSYLLHPNFKLPLRLYSSVKLNNILTNHKNNQLSLD
ncbi:hypothetical protein [Pedobacter sp. Leaf194]|uniref:ORC-CDC6 family AAA ATPase n=1 Tax=Pedobacter sp. Leaf194 TaxID=1736297 RepID=UPI0007038412|nr:hypothetical protein [Pedobacter sp. Leaf194]KQS36829.1 hypothetical protein ASG14_07265 [Pedobacter sp. Leaf194]